MIKGRVIKGVTSKYLVDTPDGVMTCLARGKLKQEGNILIGDFVELTEEKSGCVIEKVLPRKNSLIRPYVANVDVCFIVIAPLPAPDFKLVDKIIINALDNDIKPVLILNKEDLTDNAFKDAVLADYTDALEIAVTSAKTGGGIDNLLSYASGKVACLAGQSAVGKSSLLNFILGGEVLETGGLSAKIERGRHTTRQSVIIKTGGAYIIDTCGFSMLEFPPDFKPDKLASFYPEFGEYAVHCKFRAGCTHTAEPDCMIKQAVAEGRISNGRYTRYVELYNQLLDKWRRRYD